MLHLELTQMALPFLDAAVVDELVRRGPWLTLVVVVAHNLLLVVERACCPSLSNLIYTNAVGSAKKHCFLQSTYIKSSQLATFQLTFLLLLATETFQYGFFSLS
jgi:hypothetical protein